jgi:hypothetical protein
MPMNRDDLLYVAAAQAFGNAGSEYSDDEIDTEITTPAWNRGHLDWGLNMIVTTTYTDLDSGCFLWAVHGAATGPTTEHTGMFIPVASLVKGARFFVPLGKGVDMLRYIRGYFEVVSENATLGNSDMYFGPRPD